MILLVGSLGVGVDGPFPETCTGKRRSASRLAAMGAWYTIGLFAGLGVAAGVLLAALVAPSRGGLPLALLLGVAAGAGGAILVAEWPEAVAAAVGGALGALGGSQIVLGALRRGGGRAPTTLLVGAGALVLAALAFIPVAGYLIAVVVPALAARLRARSGRTYAGLRILARD